MLGVDDEDVCFEKFAFKALLECLSVAVTNPVVTRHPRDRNCKHGLKMVLAALCFQLLIQGALDRSAPEVVDVEASSGPTQLRQRAGGHFKEKFRLWQSQLTQPRPTNGMCSVRSQFQVKAAGSFCHAGARPA